MRPAPPESRRIVDLCEPAMSVAEVAARMLLPVGVVRVLVGDRVTVGWVVLGGVNTGQDEVDALRALADAVVERFR